MRTWGLLLATTLAAAPAVADKRLDDAVAKAESHAAKGRPEEALKTLQKLADQSSSPEAYLALARLQERLASAEDVQASVTRAVALSASASPEIRAEALAALSSLELGGGTGRDALTHAEQALQAAPASGRALATLARAQARAKDGATALATADRAVQAAPLSGLAHVARGEALLALGRAKDSEAEFRRALEVEPRLTLARTKLATALLAQGNAAAAEGEARRATESDERSGEAFAVLGRAILARDPKRWGDAIAQAQQGAFVSPSAPLVHLAVGDIFEAHDDLDQAASAYGRALAADPGFTPARLATVRVLVRLGRNDAALAELRKLVQEMPANAQAHLQLGSLSLRMGDWPGAVSALERAVTLAPSDAEAHARLGTAYQYVRKSPEALAAYKRAVELDPASLDYRSTYGLLLGIAGQADAGAAELQRVVSTPGYADATGYVNLGWLYRNTRPKRTQDSVAAYKKALELDPKEEQAALGLGGTYLDMKSWDAAIAAFNQALQIDPSTAGEANNGIGWSYLLQKDAVKAREHMEKGAAAGRLDARLEAAIERLEKGIDTADTTPDLPAPGPAPRIERPDAGTISAILLGARDAGARHRAARDLASYGAEGVPALIRAVTADADWSVREAAAVTLGSLGARAGMAVPHLRFILASPREVDGIMLTDAQMAESMREEDYRKAVRHALQKIAGK